MDQDQKSFIVFVILVFLTSTLFYITESGSYNTLGVLGVIWGVFGFYRFIYFIAGGDVSDSARKMTLPQALLFGFKGRAAERRQYIIHQVSRRNVLSWFGVGLFFLLWMSIQTYFPANDSVIEAYKQ